LPLDAWAEYKDIHGDIIASYGYGENIPELYTTQRGITVGFDEAGIDIAFPQLILNLDMAVKKEKSAIEQWNIKLEKHSLTMVERNTVAEHES
jgi:hypothetical protein